MKTKTISGAKIAATAIALLLSGAVAASAEDKPKKGDKQTTEKMECGKNGCAKNMEKSSTDGAHGEAKPGDAK